MSSCAELQIMIYYLNSLNRFKLQSYLLLTIWNQIDKIIQKLNDLFQIFADDFRKDFRNFYGRLCKNEFFPLKLFCVWIEIETKRFKLVRWSYTFDIYIRLDVNWNFDGIRFQTRHQMIWNVHKSYARFIYDSIWKKLKIYPLNWSEQKIHSAN